MNTFNSKSVGAYLILRAWLREAGLAVEGEVCRVEGCTVGLVGGSKCLREILGPAALGPCRLAGMRDLGLSQYTRGRSGR